VGFLDDRRAMSPPSINPSWLLLFSFRLQILLILRLTPDLGKCRASWLFNNLVLVVLGCSSFRSSTIGCGFIASFVEYEDPCMMVFDRWYVCLLPL
jgi:hypothetical protein